MSILDYFLEAFSRIFESLDNLLTWLFPEDQGQSIISEIIRDRKNVYVPVVLIFIFAYVSISFPGSVLSSQSESESVCFKNFNRPNFSEKSNPIRIYTKTKFPNYLFLEEGVAVKCGDTFAAVMFTYKTDASECLVTNESLAVSETLDFVQEVGLISAWHLSMIRRRITKQKEDHKIFKITNSDFTIDVGLNSVEGSRDVQNQLRSLVRRASFISIKVITSSEPWESKKWDLLKDPGRSRILQNLLHNYNKTLLPFSFDGQGQGWKNILIRPPPPDNDNEFSEVLILPLRNVCNCNASLFPFKRCHITFRRFRSFGTQDNKDNFMSVLMCH